MTVPTPLIPRILCVENDSSLRRALQEVLERYGFQVVTASDGMEALIQYQAREGKFEAIVTDHDLPLMNGRELVSFVRKMGFTGRIVVISSGLSPEDLRSFHDHAVVGFFPQPFELDLSRRCSCRL